MLRLAQCHRKLVKDHNIELADFIVTFYKRILNVFAKGSHKDGTGKKRSQWPPFMFS